MRNRLNIFSLPFLFSAIFLFPALALAQTNGVTPLITQPVDDSNLIVLHGNTYPLAQPQYDRGAAPSALPMQRTLLVLQRSPLQEAALDQLLEQQQDNSSPSYHQWLTPAQFGAQFGPTDQDVQTVTLWLQSHGFHVNRVSSGRIVIEFSGTAGQVQEAFHTSIHKYEVNGESHWANSSDPQIPAALGPVVAGVRSLHNFPAKPMNHPAGVFHRDAKSGKIVPSKPVPIPQFLGGSGCGIVGGPCEFLGPYDLAAIYDISPLWTASSPIDGTGQTIAIVGETDINPADWTVFWNAFGVTTPEGNLKIILDGPDPGFQGDESEADIDTQWSSAVAKGATIDFVESESTESTLGVDLSAEYIVDNNLAPVMSESYGLCELFIGTTGNAYYNALWQQASAQGITVFVSSGDQGAAVCDRGDSAAQFGLAVSGFGSTAYNVAVGGTDFSDLNTTSTYWNPTNNANQANAKGYIPEETWNDTCTNAEIFVYFLTTTASQTCNNATAQNDGFLGVAGGSGGASACTNSNGQSASSCTGGNAKPPWQTGTGVPNDTHRDVPDVSLFASNGFNGSGYIVCQSDQTGPCNLNDGEFLGFGGTSVSSPAFAGIMALVNQKTGERQGNANYVLYKMAATAANSCNSSTVASTGSNSCIFYDVTTGTNAMPCVASSGKACTIPGGDEYGVLSGYATTSGYDQATGLGSVNVANLVNQWSAYAGQFKATKFSAFTLGPPTTITHGQPIAVTATVVPQTGTGTPTGTITLTGTTGSSASGQQAAQQVLTLTNGSITAGATTTMLPGGTNYSVTAHYSGDSTYAPSDSGTQSVTVNPEPSKTFVDLLTFDINGNLTSFGASGATYGSGYYLLRLDVGNSAATVSSSKGISSTCSNRTASCPTGTIAITSNGTALDGGSLALNSEGYAEDQSLGADTYAVAANYSGDPSYEPSSTAANFTIAKAATTSSAALSGTPVQYGAPEQIDGQILTSSNGAEPTGTFSFSLDGSPLTVSDIVYEGFPYQPTTTPPQYAYLGATGLAAFDLAIGTHSITMQYSGDANYAPSTSPPFTFTLTKGLPDFTTSGASPSTINLGQQTTLNAQLFVYGSGASPTGTMTFYDGGTALSGTVTYTSEPEGLTADMIYTPTTAGTHAITVGYSGDANYLPATTAPPGATLTVIGPTFMVSASPSTVIVASPGAAGTTTLTFTVVNGYTGTIPLSSSLCSGMPSETTCSFSVPSVILSSSATTATATVTFQTTAPGAATAQPGKRPSGFDWRVATPGVAMACIFCMGLLLASFRNRLRRWSMALAMIAFASLLAIASCGGGGGETTIGPPPPPPNPGTPAENDVGVVITFSGANATPTPKLSLTVDVE